MGDDVTHERTPAQIAQALSPAQRRALMWLPPDVHMARTQPGKFHPWSCAQGQTQSRPSRASATA